MPLIVPLAIQTAAIQNMLSVDLKIRLYSNNYVPTETSVVGSFTEVSGGGYSAITMASAGWAYSPVPPVSALQPTVSFEFTGATDSPGTVYGYYITDLLGTTLYWAETMPEVFFPFTPVNGATVRITPYLAVSGGRIGG